MKPYEVTHEDRYGGMNMMRSNVPPAANRICVSWMSSSWMIGVLLNLTDEHAELGIVTADFELPGDAGLEALMASFTPVSKYASRALYFSMVAFAGRKMPFKPER